ncbi:Hypothetical protein CFV354_1471 [Campylobacter fetus subsp. venerealis NCTC 10354]|nr:Hypothetical protein CFV354_1471 [Campylobacter fetus subsp. venerealis NCTC 10354]
MTFTFLVSHHFLNTNGSITSFPCQKRITQGSFEILLPLNSFLQVIYMICIIDMIDNSTNLIKNLSLNDLTI